MSRGIVILMLVVLLPQSFTYGNPEKEQSTTQEISEELMTYFKKSIMKRVKRLEHYITLIANKEREDKIRRNAIDQAVELFETDEKVVQVSYMQAGQTKIKEYPVRTYFDRLYAIKANRVDITFYEVTQLTDIRQGIDGNYFATAYIFQDTKIYYTDESEVPDYQDQTTKAIDVSIKPDTVVIGDKPVVLYPAKLGNINVEETR